MQNIEQKIIAYGYQLSDFAEELLDGYQCLLNANIIIPENVLNPQIELGFFGVYAEFIAAGNKELEITLPYLQPGMSFRHCKLVSNALITENNTLLGEYVKIFTNEKLSKDQKIALAELAEAGERYEHLLSTSGEELLEINREIYLKRKPLSDNPLLGEK